MSRSIKVVPYHSHWPSLYRLEARKIAAAWRQKIYPPSGKINTFEIIELVGLWQYKRIQL